MADFDTNTVGLGSASSADVKTRANRFDRADFVARQSTGLQSPAVQLRPQEVAVLRDPSARAAAQPADAPLQPSTASFGRAF